MSEKISFRLANHEDKERLIGWLNDKDILSWFPMCNYREVEDSVRICLDYAKDKAALIVSYDGEPCGFGNLYLPAFKKISHQCLFMVVIDKNFRNKGIGTFLVKELMKMAKDKFKIKLFHLEVYVGNPAYNLYKRLGFHEFGYEKNFFKEDGKYIDKRMMQIKL